jgi:hypothetical protein
MHRGAVAMPDDRTYIKVHDGLPDHPKIVGLSLAAKWALLTYWCYSSRHLTDGMVPRVIAAREGKKAVAELEKAGLIESRGDDWYCHDYLEHQRSAAEVQELRDKRREAGSKGGKAKANAMALAKQKLKQTGSKSVAETDTDTEELEKNSSSRAAQKRGTRINDDWKPTPAEVTWQREHGIDDGLARRELPKFIDYWQSQAGQRALKTDWPATWRNWLRAALERTPKPQQRATAMTEW